MLEVKITVDVSTEPVLAADAKAFMVVDSGYTADDVLILSMCKSARQLLEAYTNLSFAPQTRKAYTDKHCLDIPYGPITAVTNVIDQNDTEITADNYTLRGLDFKKIFIGSANLDVFYPLGGGPPIYDSPIIKNYYTITYTCGYTTLPDALKLAIKEQVNHMYNTRGETQQSNEPKLCLAAKMLADPFSKRTWL